MQCIKLDYIDVNGVHHYKPKKKYLTLDDAIFAAKKVNTKEGLIHKFVAYKCNECFKYHIGKSKTLIKN